MCYLRRHVSNIWVYFSMLGCNRAVMWLVEIILLKSVASLSWGAYPSFLILLYRGLIGSVLEYGSVCFTNMAKTHMLGLKRVQYRALRFTLGLMGATPNNFLGVLSGIPPLAERFAYLNFRCLVAAFYRLDHPLRERLGVLGCWTWVAASKDISKFYHWI
jgi:hypothetical protein